MRVWNPQLEHHLGKCNSDNVVDDDDDDDSNVSKDNDTIDDSLKDNDYSGGKSISQTNVRINTENNGERRNGGIQRVGANCLVVLMIGLAGYALRMDGLSTLMFGTFTTVTLLCFIVWYFFQDVRHLFGIIIPKRRDSRIQTCRIELSKLLGSIGAAPLQSATPNDNNDTKNMTRMEYDLVLEFGKAHVDWLKQVDGSLKMLRTAAGMSLQTTLAFVDRVELAKVHCHHSSNVSLATVRRRLSQVMVDQYESLRRCYGSVVIHHEMMVERLEPIEVPDVITLAWLKSLRHELANLLSQVLSHLVASSGNPCFKITSLRPVQYESTCRAIESKEYLSSMFSLPSSSPPETSTVMTNNVVVQELVTLGRQLDAASIALWACVSSYQDDHQPNEAEVLLFLNQLESLFGSFSVVKDRLQAELGSRITANDADQAAPANESDEPRDELAHGQTTSLNYEDVGIRLNAAPSPKSNEDALHNNNKTVVFTGSGSISKQAFAEISVIADGQQIVPPPQVSFRKQRQMLQELQLRLSQMNRVDEVTADGTPADDGSDTKRATNEMDVKEEASSMFLGAFTGELLKDLKTSIGSVKQGELS